MPLPWDDPDSTPLEDIRAAAAELEDIRAFAAEVGRSSPQPLTAWVGPDHWIAKDPEARAALKAQGWDLVVLDAWPDVR